MNRRHRQWSEVSGQARVAGAGGRRARRAAWRGGFTLIEVLVVILIILIVSAVALPTILPAMAHRQMSEAARLLQGALNGMRDSALHDGNPSGMRLLPDPAFPLVYQTVNGQPTGLIDWTQPLAANRMIPIEAAPEYTEGALFAVNPAFFTANNTTFNIPYPAINGGTGQFYPIANNSVVGGPNVLMVAEVVVSTTGVLSSPTSWFWNIRVGDKLQINGAGLWYTVVGPMVMTPQDGNSELFVNVGPAGTQSPFGPVQQGVAPNTAQVFPEFLFLVNGLDDNQNGWIDEGYDGVDNNFNGVFDEVNVQVNGVQSTEWEQETWPATVISTFGTNQPYTIQRRPAPAANSRETALPTNVVIDLTTWNNPSMVKSGYQERSQFPPGVINPYTGYVDILVYPNGTVVPTTIYSSPSSFGMSGAFFHFWLAERSDVVAMKFNNNVPQPLQAGQPVYLPVGNIKQTLMTPGAAPYIGPTLQGEYRIVTLFTRTGQITSNDNVEFDNPVNPANGTTYNPGYPFLPTEQGTRGGR
jgi:prepilin-type N-terminal cleavage/methylation domain-containing protein